ncbi:MAG: tRNA lysidine(34) synthetase TilS [Saprospiraceae bacterium]|nr:tRNA lysidine(34) synthetase TilS [Saprospiraceae bacterium]MBP6569713.1 tRNA lysidine(34) synthetase TilS [Saprospiraceae bacterium]
MRTNKVANVMLDKFLSYIKEENLFTENEKILLAVSGGMDSMAMVTLFLQAKIPIGVAHIHHHLRGAESDGDAEFIKKYCAEKKIPFYIFHIDPGQFASGNMHDTARKIRYEWLNKLAIEEKFGYVATAHHKDDVAETCIIHLMRGSGLDGLDGISSKQNNIIRPMLFADRNDILHFVKKNNILYREDSSNLADKYMRNKIRHHVLPAMYASDQRSKEGILLSINHLKKSNQLLQFLVHEYTKSRINKQENQTTIDLSFIENNDVGHELLYQVLKPYGFNGEQSTDMILHRSSTGNRYFSSHFEALTNRNTLIIRPKKDQITHEWPVYIKPPMEFKMDDYTLQFDLIPNEVSFVFEPNSLYLSTDKFTFPLMLRHWKSGDTFTPLGMQGKSQKVKDFLINHKISGFDKENIVVLEHKGDILAIPGYRISELVRIDKETKTILKVSIKKYSTD